MWDGRRIEYGESEKSCITALSTPRTPLFFLFQACESVRKFVKINVALRRENFPSEGFQIKLSRGFFGVRLRRCGNERVCGDPG